MMRKLALFFSALVLCANFSLAQNVTNYPVVEQQMESKLGIGNVLSVYIDNDATLVVWEYITSRRCSGCWLAMSSSTIMTSTKLKSPLKIIAWYIFDNDNLRELNLNERYDVEADRRYVLVMQFPSVPAGVEKVNISTNTGSQNDLVWRGIHFNNREPVSESKGAAGLDFFGNGWKESEDKAPASDDDFEASGSGTGFAISSDGLIATCQHVIDGARAIRVRGVNGDFEKTYTAKVVAADKNNDLAILQISDDAFAPLPALPYRLFERNSDVGEDVFALGYPLRAVMGDEIKLTNGIISSKSGYQGDLTSYQISVAVQPGNSGCPLFNQNGDVVGIVNARLAVESAAYAIKTPYLKTLAESSDLAIGASANTSLAGKSLAEQVKIIKKFIYIIEIE